LTLQVLAVRFFSVAVVAVLAALAPSGFPYPISLVAAVACARLYALWVELGLLIKRNCISGVLSTENVTAMAAVMLPYK
jgi:hypothetical protein